MSFCSPAPPAGIHGPIIGIVDGSDAPAGDVGEWFTSSATGNFISQANPQGFNLQILTLPPGDWNLSAGLTVDFNIDGAGFFLAPIPAGVNSDLKGRMMMTQTEEAFGMFVVAPTVRGNVTIPTLLTMHVDIINSAATGTASGTFTMSIFARRAR